AEQTDHALRLAAHDWHDIAHDLEPIEALGMAGQCFPQTAAKCLAEHRSYVELRHTRAREPLDVLIANAGSAVDHERHRDRGADARQARKVDDGAGSRQPMNVS